jgi:aryl-alcohol dehydrogenase-like predicted oxidoreductase
MTLRRLGASDLKIAPLVLGGNVFGWTADRAASFAVLDAFVAGGGTMIDTADVYSAWVPGHQGGESEATIGEWLKASGKRDDVLIATKVGMLPGDGGEKLAPARIAAACDASLQRLGVETIDLYQLHRPDLLMNPPEIAEAFEQLHKSGKVRYFGVSNFVPSFVSLLQSGLKEKLIVNQVEIHLGRLDCFYDGTLDQCLEKQITPLSWSPLGGGFLAGGGKLDPKHPKFALRYALVELLDEIAARHNVTHSVLALAWLLKHPSGIIPIVGSANPKNIKAAVAADSLEISREDWYRILVAARGEKLP